MFGRFCFWCGGQRVGDYTLVTSLRDVLFGVEGVLRYAGRRRSVRFNRVPAADLLQQLSKGLFGEGDPSEPLGDVTEEEWARHIALPAVDVFDAWSAFVVEDSESARLVTSHLPDGVVRELSLRPGEFDEVLLLVQAELNELYARSERRDPE